MDILREFDRVNRMAKAEIVEQRKTMKKMQAEINRLQKELVNLKNMIANSAEISKIQGSGTGNYYDDGTLTINVLETNRYNDSITPLYYVQLHIKGKYVENDYDCLIEDTNTDSDIFRYL